MSEPVLDQIDPSSVTRSTYCVSENSTTGSGHGSKAPRPVRSVTSGVGHVMRPKTSGAGQIMSQ